MKPLVNVRANSALFSTLKKKIYFYDEYLNIAGNVKRSDDQKSMTAK